MKALRYFFCVVLPPVAILMTGRMGSFLLSILLTLSVGSPASFTPAWSSPITTPSNGAKS